MVINDLQWVKEPRLNFKNNYETLQCLRTWSQNLMALPFIVSVIKAIIQTDGQTNMDQSTLAIDADSEYMFIVYRIGNDSF